MSTAIASGATAEHVAAQYTNVLYSQGNNDAHAAVYNHVYM